MIRLVYDASTVVREERRLTPLERMTASVLAMTGPELFDGIVEAHQIGSTMRQPEHLSPDADLVLRTYCNEAVRRGRFALSLVSPDHGFNDGDYLGFALGAGFSAERIAAGLEQLHTLGFVSPVAPERYILPLELLGKVAARQEVIA